MLELRLAWRNVWRHPRRTWLTVAAMVFCNVLLVFLIALQLGNYQMMIDNTLQAFSGHIQIQKAGYQDEPSLRKSIDNIRDVESSLNDYLINQQSASNANTPSSSPRYHISSRAMGFALLSSEERSYGVQVIGVNPDEEPSVSTLPGLIVEGSFFESGQLENNRKGIVVGKVLANNLRVNIGDSITLLGSGRDGTMAADVLVVVGIFESGMVDMDRSLAQISLSHFQELFSMAEGGHVVVIKANEFSQAEGLYQAALQWLNASTVPDGQDLTVLNWDALHPGLKQAIQADMGSAIFMYAVLVVLVAFSVMNTQLMSVLERTREFGVVMSLGLRAGQLARLVLLETSLMAGLGLVLGVIGGGILVGYLNVNGFSISGMEEMASRFNMSPVMYPQISFISIFSGPLVIFICSLLAAVYPALRLHFLRPIEAMRAV